MCQRYHCLLEYHEIEENQAVRKAPIHPFIETETATKSGMKTSYFFIFEKNFFIVRKPHETAIFEYSKKIIFKKDLTNFTKWRYYIVRIDKVCFEDGFCSRLFLLVIRSQ